jgi:hypothetical protein
VAILILAGCENDLRIVSGFSLDDLDIARVVDWLVNNQLFNGLWKTGYKEGVTTNNTGKELEKRLWLILRICRIMKQLYRLAA